MSTKFCFTIRRMLASAALIAFAAPTLAVAADNSSSAKLATNAASTAADAYPKEIRIAYQKGNSLVILKGSGALEKALAPHHVTVRWNEFLYGPPEIEALSAGDVDVGFIGGTPPVFAQAGGAPNLVYVGYAAAYRENYAIVVAKTSTAHDLADLKGKRIGVAKGSNGESLLLSALDNAHLQTTDVDIAYLQYSDARSAFERGDIAAWVVPDPRLADTELTTGARPIVTASQLPAEYSFYVASRSFATRYPAVTRIVLDQVNQTERYASKHLDETAAFLEKDTHVPSRVWRYALGRQPWGVNYPLSDEVIKAQQGVADIFWSHRLIPKPVQVREAVVDVRG